MNTTKSVYNKLFKEEATELASHEINLSLHDEAMAAYKLTFKAGQSAIDEMKKVKAAVDTAKSNMQGYAKVYQNSEEAFARLEKLVKEIGVPLPPQVVNDQKTVKENLRGFITTYIKILNSIKF
jgi:outer membrane protein TolC